jgi:predicted nucleic acid-binding protein
MTTSHEFAALDTNALIYSLYADAEHHRVARLLLEQAKSPHAAFCLTPQVLAEFYSVVTNPRRVTEAKSPDAVLDAITNLLAMPGLTLLPFPLDLVSRWMALLRQHPVTRP